MQGKGPGVVPCSLEDSRPVEDTQPAEDSRAVVGGTQPVEDSLVGVVVAGGKVAVMDKPAVGVVEGRLERQKEISIKFLWLFFNKNILVKLANRRCLQWLHSGPHLYDHNE